MIRFFCTTLALIPTLALAQATGRIPEMPGNCQVVPSTASTAPSNFRVSCESIRELQVNPNGTQTPKTRLGQMPGTTTVSGVTFSWRRRDGRTVQLTGPAPQRATLGQLRGLNSTQIIELMPSSFPENIRAEIEPGTLTIANFDVEDHLNQMVLPRCSYVSMEVRQINLLRFRTNISCMSAGSCLPNTIEICVARIGCVNDPEYGTTQYNTTCKASNNQCPDVSECIHDDSTTTAVERERILRNATTGATQE